MKSNSRSLLAVFASVVILLCYSSTAQAQLIAEDSGIDLTKINLPEGFKIEIFAEGITDARSLASSDDGKTVFVANRRRKNVYALTDTDGDMVADRVDTIAKDWTLPNGVAFNNGDLYVAEVNQIHRFKDIMNNLAAPKSEIIYDGYPTERHHGWKFIAFGPDGKLYVPVGAPCNVCDKSEEDEVFASITRMDPDGSNVEIFAKGVRNSVGFDWHPETNKLWFTDNGRDLLGDDIPSCELNYAPEAGMHFGFPYWHQGDIPDPDFGSLFPQENFTAPAYKLEPHSAPLGMRFYTGTMFPEKYQNNLIIAQHGSWNRTPEAGHIGYQLRFVAIDNDKVVSSEVFADGWLNKGTNKGWGKPVDILQMPDGSILVSDDVAGAIYRISYSN